MPAFHVARQPILDAEGHTFGYELLFRSGETNAYDPGIDGDAATSRVLVDTVIEIGIERIVGDAWAFINLTDRFLEHPELLELLPPGRVVLEVLETVTPSPAVIAGIRLLKARGHVIALDDFEYADELAPLVELADIIKYDITQHERAALLRCCAADHEAGRRVLAERVETSEEFEALKAGGFDYFQGYFFARPRLLSGSKLPSHRVALLQLIERVADPNAPIAELAELTSQEIALGVRALRYVNSPMNGLRVEVTSIRQAITLLGRGLLRNWVMLLMMSGVDDKPEEVVRTALVRARFCQLAAQRLRIADDAHFFTIGLLSMLDVLMDSTLEKALEGMSATEEIRAVLLRGEGRAAAVLALARSVERADGRAGEVPAPDTALAALDPAALHEEAILWAQGTARLFES